MRLGVASAHGRPYHPQTQGKVENFNGTLQRELGPALRQPTLEDAARISECFRSRYNWERPHEALDMRVPGSLYKQSSPPRPDRLPDHEIAPTFRAGRSMTLGTSASALGDTRSDAV
ncbi:MAG: integrase core domain-containing protein [Fimbriimonadales bacterium]